MGKDGLDFRFNAALTSRYLGYDKGRYPPHYRVWLPHQCDDWEITASLSKEQAVEEMEQFVVQAQNALDKLKQL